MLAVSPSQAFSVHTRVRERHQYESDVTFLKTQLQKAPQPGSNSAVASQQVSELFAALDALRHDLVSVSAERDREVRRAAEASEAAAEARKQVEQLFVALEAQRQQLAADSRAVNAAASRSDADAAPQQQIEHLFRELSVLAQRNVQLEAQLLQVQSQQRQAQGEQRTPASEAEELRVARGQIDVLFAELERYARRVADLTVQLGRDLQTPAIMSVSDLRSVHPSPEARLASSGQSTIAPAAQTPIQFNGLPSVSSAPFVMHELQQEIRRRDDDISRLVCDTVLRSMSTDRVLQSEALQLVTAQLSDRQRPYRVVTAEPQQQQQSPLRDQRFTPSPRSRDASETAAALLVAHVRIRELTGALEDRETSLTASAQTISDKDSTCILDCWYSWICF